MLGVSLPVNEIFQTIQGEATWTGTPAVFVRLQGCPVGCAWCDTKHTWPLLDANAIKPVLMLAKTSDSVDFARMDVGAILAVVQGFEARHVVITGGEPCERDLVALTAALLEAGRSVQVETSGTAWVRVAPATFVTVSPKLDMPGGRLVRLDALKRADEIKHPVGKMSDWDKLVSRVLDRIPAPRSGVWLQPLSQNKTATALCVQLATAYGHRVSIQTHKYLGVR